MSEVVTTRRKRREQPKPLDNSVQSLELFLIYLRDIERMRQYRLIGRLARVQILRPEGAKVIDFRKEGPVLAFAEGTEQLIVTDPWRGIPPKWDETDKFCEACLAKCDVCDGGGKGMCQYPRCGGGGLVPLPVITCIGDGCVQATGKIKPGCATCGGTGMYVGKKECPLCHGTGKGVCNACRGTGKRPTGTLNGSARWQDPTCPECRGSRFAHREVPQDFNSFVNARIGSMVALGPIVRFAVEAVGGEGSPPQVWDVDADANGQHLVILLENHPTEPAGETTRAYMIGGVLRRRSQ